MTVVLRESGVGVVKEAERQAVAKLADAQRDIEAVKANSRKFARELPGDE